MAENADTAHYIHPCPMIPQGLEFHPDLLAELRRKRLIEPQDEAEYTDGRSWHLRHTDYDGDEDEARAERLWQIVSADNRWRNGRA